MKKILIVEDDSDFREILHRFITKLGHHAIKARNSKEAIECAEAEQPDLIFMDLDLPYADGIKTTAILRQNPKTSHIPVVAITAWMAGKGCESRHHNVSNKTDHPSGIEGNHRPIY